MPTRWAYLRSRFHEALTLVKCQLELPTNDHYFCRFAPPAGDWRNIRVYSLSPSVGHSIQCRWMVHGCRRRLALYPDPPTPSSRPSARVVLLVHPGAGDSVRVAVDAGAALRRPGLCAPRASCGDATTRRKGRDERLPGWPTPPQRLRVHVRRAAGALLSRLPPAPVLLRPQVSLAPGRVSLVERSRVPCWPPWPDSFPVASNPGSPNDAPPGRSPPASSSDS